MTLRPLNVRITGNTEQLDAALGRARGGLRALAVSAGAAAGVVVGALTAMTVQGLRAADQLAKTSRSMDASANGLRAVQIAGGYAGVSITEVNTALQQMNRELIRGRDSATPAGQALARLGLEAEALERLDADDRIALIADRVQELGLSAGETADFLRDLGVRSRNMALVFQAGGGAIRAAREEVRAFGLELSNEQLAAIESANDAISRVGLVFESLRNQLAVEVAPILQTVADSFNAFAQSDAAQRAVEGLADAFGELLSIASSEDFMSAAIGAFEGLVGIATSLSQSLISVSQNIETVTTAATGAAIALAAMGGPITLIVGSVAVAAAGIYTLAQRADTMAISGQSAADAQHALNEALDGFTTSGQTANGVSVQRALELQRQAEAAIAAAEAELLLQQTRVQAVSGFGAESAASNPALPQIIAEAEEAAARVADLQTQLDNIRRTVSGLRIGGEGAGSGDGVYTLPPVTLSNNEECNEDPIIPGLPSAGAVTGALEGRLDALRQGLASERELLDAWYAEGQEILASSREAELISEQEYQERRLQLEEEYARRSNEIERMRGNANLRTVAQGVDSILGAVAQGNNSILQAQGAFAAGMAWIDTLQGAARMLRNGTFGFAQAAAVLAKGATFVSAIQSVASGGGGGAGSGAASSSATSAAANNEQSQVARTLNVQLVGGDLFGSDQIRNLFTQINEHIEDGGTLSGVSVS